MDRRKFVKNTGLAVGGLVTAGTLASFSIPEKQAFYEANKSFWALEGLPANSPLQKSIAPDITIIGGGYTGLSTAYHLKLYNPLLHVVLLEAKHVGHGASGRHGGMVLPQPPTESFEIAYDINVHKATYGLTVQSMYDIREVLKKYNTDADLKLDGFCHTILDEADIGYYQNYVKEVNAVGMPLEFWDATKTELHLGTDYYAGSVFDPNGGSIHAVKFINALKHAAESIGVEIFEQSEVSEIVEGKIIQLRVNGRAVRVNTRNLVLATNGYTSKLGYFANRILPVHAQTAVTAPLTQKQLEDIGWESRLPFFDSNNYLFHLVLRDDNRIVIGGGNAEYYFRGDLKYHGNLQTVNQLTMDYLKKVYPQLHDLQLDYTWDGILCMTDDDTPMIGCAGAYSNIFYGIGYNGQGVNLSFLFGNVIASRILGRKNEWLQTPYYNHLSGYLPPEPFRWLGAKMMMEYYKNQDNQE